MSEWKGIERLEQEIMTSPIGNMQAVLRRELEPLLKAAEETIKFYEAHGGPMGDLRKAVERWK